MSEQLPQINVTSRIANRLIYKAAFTAALEECQLSDSNEKKVTVQTLYSGISRGTEGLVFSGRVPESEWDRMQCPHQNGEFSYPVSYGYACVGKVIEIQSDVKHIKKDDIVFVLHPHQDIFCVSESACNLISDGLPPSRAVLCANMETALNAVWDAQTQKGNHHAVIGAGVVGLLSAYILKKLFGVPPVIIDINEEKRTIAEKLGISFMTPQEVMTKSLQEMERVFNTSASGQGLQLAIDMAAFEGRIIEMSWYGEKQVTLDLGGAFHSKRLQIISSQVGHVAPSRRQTHTYADRMKEAMQLLDDPVLDVLLEPQIRFEELPDHLHDIFSDKSSALCQLVKYTDK